MSVYMSSVKERFAAKFEKPIPFNDGGLIGRLCEPVNGPYAIFEFPYGSETRYMLMTQQRYWGGFVWMESRSTEYYKTAKEAVAEATRRILYRMERGGKW